MSLEPTAPPSGAALRAAIYAGQMFKLPRCPASETLVSCAWACLRAAFEDVARPRRAQHQLPIGDLLRRLTTARRRLAADPVVLRACADLLDHHGLDPGAHVADDLRLRAVLSGGHEHPDAAPVYVAHRDTWYANPRCQLNWWIPLHDVDPADAFDLYPTAFRRTISNDSAAFDYQRFISRAGWQAEGPTPGITYPGTTQGVAGLAPVSAAARRGEVVVFSAAHLHQTREHAEGQTRFSVDLRTAHLADHAAGRGAPDPDNASTGAAVEDYSPLAQA